MSASKANGDGRKAAEGEQRRQWSELADDSVSMTVQTSGELVPYFPVFIDAGIGDFAKAAAQCLRTYHNRERQILELQTMWTTPANPNLVLPVLSVRTGFDLFLRVMNFPAGSEIIMSALNIPDMMHVVRHHKLHIVPLDISIENVSPKVELLPQLVSPRTVAILIAHVYGKWSPMDEIITFAKKRNIYVVEDCAECFCGFDKLSHPETDIALFSFGVIKFYTSFGGAITKIKDKELYAKMIKLHDTYPIQSQATYLKKVLRYFGMYHCLDVPCFSKPAVKVLRVLNVDYMYHAVKMLRGFPDQLMLKIQERPSGALLATMLDRQRAFSATEFCLQCLKGEYVMSRLPPGLDVVGSKAEINNYWLFPVITENPDNLVFLLNALGVEAYRGATQLNVVEPHNGDPDPLVLSADHSRRSPTSDKNTLNGEEDMFLVSCGGDSRDQACAGKGDSGDGLYKPVQESGFDLRGDCGDGMKKPIEESDFDFSLRRIPSAAKEYPLEDSSVDSSCLHMPTARKEFPHHEESSVDSSCAANKESPDDDESSVDLPSQHIPEVNRRYPHEAKYIIDHVVYLPVHKQVPFHQLNRMLRAIKTAVTLHKSSNGAGVKVSSKL